MVRTKERGKIAVIGAGPGGLATAMLLAARGYDVQVYEKQAVVGGRSGLLQLGDYRFDRGATFLMMPQILEEIFAAAGRSLSEELEIRELESLYSLHFGDTVFSPSRNLEDTAAQIAQLFPGDEDGYKRFMRDEEAKFERIMPLLQRPFASLRDYLKMDVLRALPVLHAHESVYRRLSRYFKDERLRLSFTFQAKYLGMSPWECPGTFTILSFIEHKYGLYHPIGGVNRIFTAMARIIRELGGQVHTSCAVKQILVKNRKAVGVLLDNGERIEADHVVINADFASAMNHLFEPGLLRKYAPQKLEQKRYSLSTAMLYLGVDGTVDLPHHSVHFANDYRRNVEEMTRLKTASADPSIYVHNPSVLDPTLAPAGKTALYTLMPVPNLTGSIDWERDRERMQAAMMERLEQIPELSGLSRRVEEALFFTPLDWQNRLDVHQGATFNLAHNLGQMMAFRPHNRFEEIDRVWLVGGGTHPGSGLPTIFESARITSRLLEEEDLRLRDRGHRIKAAVETGRTP
ncbi:phytoene desaturase family protein [Paenibacillus chibensis]|uniref:Phytoene desaturase family protein n=1 Tax=Paenibacillus chibensis TaxID=59846 RepID=A0ABU6Q0X1_9BACL|nr:phytoene desaturase family protein [Paenibacillus chibensis]